MIHTRRYVNKAKYAPRMIDSLKPLDVCELLKKEIKNLKTKIEIYKENEKKYKKENESLLYKIATIENEVKKNKTKK